MSCCTNMRNIQWEISTGFENGVTKGVFQVGACATEKEIEERILKEMHKKGINITWDSVDSTPLCRLINSQFSWILEVDNHRVAFTGFDNADYFEEHYKSLGYEVVRESQYKRGGE
jgi:hypothetical protein